MAGQPENVDRDTGQRFDGSALIAMKADPSFTQLRFCELEPRTAILAIVAWPSATTRV
jgi:hypothetical protein